MTLTFRPLMILAAATATLFVGHADAKKMASAPPPPAACTDFYGFVNTPWLRSHPLPPGVSSRSLWDELNELGARQRDSLFTTPLQNAGPAQNKINSLMQSADEIRVKADSDRLLATMLAEINRIKKPKDVSVAIANLHARGLPALFDFNTDKDNTFSAHATGLPELGFYTKQDQPVAQAQARYRTYIETLLATNGMPAEQLRTASGHVFSMEKQLAGDSGESPSLQLSVKDAGKQFPNLQFANYLRTQKSDADKIVVAQPIFFKTVNGLINAKMIEHWKSYLRFHVLNQMSPYLNEPYFAAHGQFYEVYLEGRPFPKSRTQKLRELIESSAPGLVDAAYTERYIDAARRQRAREVVDAILQAAEQAVVRSTTIVNPGEERDLKSLKALKVEIGRDPKTVPSLEPGENLASNAAKLLRRAQSIKNKQDADNWPGDIVESTPLLVYMANDNRIIITGALLQAPVFDAQGGAVDYGAFGSLFAQQLSLAIYQSTFKNMATKSAQRDSIVAQYNAYTLSGNKKVNGMMTSTQNLADLSGLEFALQAYIAKGTRDKMAQQDFFKAWANLWSRVDLDSALLASYDRSIHAPAKWRVNGPLANMSAFGTTFSCKAGAMQRPYKEQLRLWP